MLLAEMLKAVVAVLIRGTKVGVVEPVELFLSKLFDKKQRKENLSDFGE